MSAFKECDIRGIYATEVDEKLARRIGRAMAEMAATGELCVGGDVRVSTPALKSALIEGMVAGGRNVVDFGILPTPAYYHALADNPGLMVTASHNPAEFNGFKPRLGAMPVTPEEIREIERLCRMDLPDRPPGTVARREAIEPYLSDRMARFERLPPAAIVIDCGNGSFSTIAPAFFRRLGCSVTELFCEPDGRFPNREPNPADPNQLTALKRTVVDSGVDLGIAFDGDGDRVAFVSKSGKYVPADSLIALLAREMLRDHPGAAVIYDLKCSSVVRDVVEQYGGMPLMERSGHTFIRARMIRENAIFGGEVSGHYFYEELRGGDDGLFTAALVIKMLNRWGDLDAAIGRLPRYVILPDIRLPYSEDRDAVIQAIRAGLRGAELSELDGVRAQWPDAWGLARPSVTEEKITFRFEGMTTEALLRAVSTFAELVPAELGDRLREAVAYSIGSLG